MNVVALHQTSKPHELAREINRLTDGIERDSKLAGQHLATLKAGKPPGITWEHYLRECGVKISARHADRLIEGFRSPSRKPPTPKPPPSDIVSEPIIEDVDEFPDRKTPKPADQKSLYDEGCALLERMDPTTRRKFFKHQEQNYLACCEEERDGFERQIEHLKAEIAKLRQKLDPGRCEWVNDDGGRRAAGYGKAAGDCGARAVSIATGKPYAEVFEALKAAHARHVQRLKGERAEYERRRRTEPIENGCGVDVMRNYMRSIGWQYTEPSGRYAAKVFLRADNLPKGRLVVLINRHYVAVIDGVIHDTYDSGEAGKRPVEGWWAAPEAAAS